MEVKNMRELKDQKENPLEISGFLLGFCGESEIRTHSFRLVRFELVHPAERARFELANRFCRSHAFLGKQTSP